MGVGEWFNGKTAAFKVADLGSNPCSPAKSISMDYLVATSGRSLSVKYLVLSSTPVIIFETITNLNTVKLQIFLISECMMFFCCFWGFIHMGLLPNSFIINNLPPNGILPK